ncbi:MAG: hypothetical protein HY901_38570 [Deltaproteobacteria bacterium]|nr:hypothetical protein [Deltaproteobacteria bacterium]
MHPLLRAFAVTCAVLCGSTVAHATEVAVFPQKVVNLTPSQADAIGAILASEYAKVSGKQVLAPAETADATREASLPAAAKALGVSEYLEGTCVALETKILISVSRRLASGEQLYSAQMTALSMDDLPEVANRLARSLAEKVPPEQTLTLDNVTRKEATRGNRLFAEKVLGLRTGFTYPVADIEPSLSLGFDGRLEGRDYFLEVGAGAFVSGDSSEERSGLSGIYAELGASYYLTHTSISPYVGGGVIPRLHFGDGMDGGLGLAPYAQAGLMFMRESSSRIYADLRVAQNVIALKRTTYDYENGNGSSQVHRYYPTELTLNVGIGW